MERKPKDIKKIEDYYKNYQFAEGKIIYLNAPAKIRKSRFLSKNVEIIKKDMLKDILEKYERYQDYITPDMEIDSRQDIQKIVRKINEFIKNLK